LINKDPHKWKSRSCKGAATKKWITKLSYPKESFFMFQTFPKHQAGWSETVVNVPAAAYSCLAGFNS
jgi:hypothetical protein